MTDLRLLADQALSRAAGAPLVGGNALRLLRDAGESYPAWLSAIEGARTSVHFESYIITEDECGARFADAFVRKAKEGVKVRVLYDWLGGLGRTSARFWRRLREGGVEVRCFNPPRLDEPFGWMRRDHRKCLVVDGQIAHVTGLCVGKMWEGSPERGLAPWRDTGVEVRGPAVAAIATAFGEAWASAGPPLLAADLPAEGSLAPAGDVCLRVVADQTGTAGLYRLDILVAALARKTLWLADAYFAGTATYVQALTSAARDGVDVRLLVPGRGSDIALMQAVSRAGYRPLLQAGVRLFEWNGPMMHAKTAVADARWARVGSTNLNLASWVGNWELDIVVEDAGFGQAMQAQYETDLAGSTEVVLHPGLRGLRPSGTRQGRARGGGGSAPRAAAGAIRIGNALGAALLPRRVHDAAERRLLLPGGFGLLVLATVGCLWPRVLAWPMALFALWLGTAFLLRAAREPRTAGPPLPPSPSAK